MSSSTSQPEETLPGAGPESSERKPEGGWAAPVSRLKVTNMPMEAKNLNVEGRQVAGALQGFGQLWQKTYKVRLSGAKVTPAEVVKTWKENFAKFQPPENRFYPSMAGVKPGEILLIDATVPAFPGTPSIMPVTSGVMVLYADDESFTVMTPEGFPESGWNTFSAYEEDGVIVVQIQSMCRATDPLYEFYFRYLGSSGQQEKTWTHVLTSLAKYFGVQGQVTISKTCLDTKVQWSRAKNIWQSAAIRTVFYKMAAPLRWSRGLFSR